MHQFSEEYVYDCLNHSAENTELLSVENIQVQFANLLSSLITFKLFSDILNNKLRK